ncbi:subtilisin-like protease SBT4.3 [Impatiens glandulifera]|uniref:subtilisin-like protease SBT4.3 n=1 Tax=Impatiens glandulifera TaxID=253017 RepID=UPI001FB1407E|nr:subtilisin-like protease SBT4.3 [Impatiens glandulifera]
MDGRPDGDARRMWWRSDLSRDYVQIHNGDETAILAHPLTCYDPVDWEFLYRHYFFTENFKVEMEQVINDMPDISDFKVHIVYMGSLPEGEYLANSHHISLLQVLGHNNIMAEKLLLKSYTRSFNSFSANLTAQEALKLKDKEGIVSVFESRKLQVQTTRSWDFMGLSLKIPRSPSIESDIIIGHIDTGVLPELKSLSDHNLRHIPKKWKGVCHGGKNFTCNKKLIGARYYAGESARDIDGHGSHSASIVAGRVVNNANFVGIANGTARGGVPSARIATYRIYDKYCYDTDAMAAFNDAIADGVDIITISIAYPTPVKISESVIAIGSFHAMQKDILTVQGAENSGINILKTVTSNAPWLFTVAASSIDRKIINKLVLGNGRTLISNALSPLGTGIHNKRLVYGRGITHHCNESSAMQCVYGCIDPDLVKGKIIVCDANVDKSDAVFAAMDANASGVILRSTNDSSFTPFPTAALNDPDFHYIQSYLKSKKKTNARILKSETVKFHAPIVASFSCKGPNIILPEILKPDITAPGINILSEYPTNIIPDKLTSKYTISSGTSLSGPHVAGAVAYVKSKHPNWSASAIKSSLMTTAWTMNKKYNLDAELGYGAGHIDPVKAVYPGLVYETFTDDYINMFCSLGLEGEKLIKMLGAKHKCPKGIRTSAKDLNYPTMSAPVYSNLSFTIQFTRIVTNIGHANSTYHAQISTEDNNIYVNVEPSVISFVRLNQRKKFVVTVSGQWPNQDHVSCSLIWFDGIHRVKSPILLYRASII